MSADETEKPTLQSQIVGHQPEIERLLTRACDGRTPPAYLFVGPHGIGKKQVALLLAQTIACEEKKRPCGRCGSCQRIQLGQSESLILLEPVNGVHKIESTREIVRQLSLGNVTRGRTVIVDRADQLNIQAANSLLKVVEDPPPQTHFIFIAPSVDAMIRTLRSRSQVVRFKALTNKELKKVGQNLALGQIDPWMIEASLGRLDRLRELTTGSGFELRGQSVDIFKQLLLGQVDFVVNHIREEKSAREEARSVIYFWQQFVRDAYYRKNNLTPILHPDLSGLTERIEQMSEENIFRFYNQLVEMDQSLGKNADVGLTFDSGLRQVTGYL